MDRAARSEVHRRVDAFALAVADPDTSLDEMALLLSAALQPGLDVIGTMAELDQLAADCPTPTRDGVVEYLFGSGTFAGDRERYHRWQNSCLDLVLEARRGMPITLAILGVEVARRLGVQLAGVGMPGHFLLGDVSDPTWFADPFHGRSDLSAEDCREIATRMGVGRWSDDFLRPTPPRAIIARVLNNLRSSCERSGDRVRLAVVMQARQALPEFASEASDATLALAVLN